MQCGSRNERIVVCDDCHGEGKVAKLNSRMNEEAWNKAMVNMLFKGVGVGAGEPMHYEYQPCTTCGGHRVLRRVKTVEYLRVVEPPAPAPEPEDEWEYETTYGGRKQDWPDEVPPPGDGWERDIDRGRMGWERFDYHEEAYWKRRKVRPAPAPKPEPPREDDGLCDL